MRMRIVAGTYEGFCYGWESHPEAASDKSADAGAAAVGSATKSMQGLKPAQPSSTTATAAAAPQPLSLVFGYNVHVGCMKSVAMATSGTRAGQLLVTGGADERVRIYDLRDRTELGELQQHNGTITCMEFYKSTHLLTGSEDNTVCIWRVHDWALLHVLGGHKAAVTSLSIHPSGRMALSVSRDRTLRLWNLLEGRCAYIKRLQGEGELVRWSPSGDSYLVVVGTAAVVYSAATSEPVGECKHDARVNSACFAGGGGAIATCDDEKTIRLFRAEGGKLVGKLNVSGACPTGRIRDMCHVAAANGESGDEDSAGSEGSLVTVTSTGGVHVWGVPALDVDGTGGAEEELRLPLLATHSLKGEPRFTCVSACLNGEIAEPTSGKSKNSKKRKQRQQKQQEQDEPEGEGARQGEGGQDNGLPGVSSSTNKKKKKSKRKKAREVQSQTATAAKGGGLGDGGGKKGRVRAKSGRKAAT